MVTVEALDWYNTEYKRSVQLGYLDRNDDANRLGKVLTENGGVASIVVHPLFPLSNSDSYAINSDAHAAAEWQSYMTALEAHMRLAVSLDRPIILFEVEGRSDGWSVLDTLQKIGVKRGRVFVVKTQAESSNPINIDLDNAARTLDRLGLKRAYISGSYYYPRGDSRRYRPGKGGCATGVEECLLNRNIAAEVDHAATFQQRFGVSRPVPTA